MKTILFFTTVLLNALSVGFFVAWSVSVILGTKQVGNYTYLETMQNINREILNPLFFTVFFGSLIALALNSFLQFNNKPVFWLVLASTLVYLIGTFGITAFGNVPLNKALDVIDITELSSLELNNFRAHYEHAWNHYHTLRTLSSMVSFILLLIATFIQKSF